jgi:hypothetical protein
MCWYEVFLLTQLNVLAWVFLVVAALAAFWYDSQVMFNEYDLHYINNEKKIEKVKKEIEFYTRRMKQALLVMFISLLIILFVPTSNQLKEYKNFCKNYSVKVVKK